MKIALRKQDDALYYRAPGTWVPQPALAHDFQGTGQALRAVQDLGLEGVHVTLTFGDPRQDVVLPLNV